MFFLKKKKVRENKLYEKVPLSENTEKVVKSLFPNKDWDFVTSELESKCGNNLPQWENADSIKLEKIRFAVLKISNGELEKFMEAMQLLSPDWRDALMESGLGNKIYDYQEWFDSLKL